MENDLVRWAQGLEDTDAHAILLRAAKEHTLHFTNPEEIGDGWARTLKDHGYGALNEYCRNFMAYQYLRRCEDIHSKKIPVL